jgi:branched-chain amino acid transport system ATP-binding protein
LFDIFRVLNRDEGVSLLIVEQNASLALDLAEDVYLIETGRMVMAGPARDLRNDATIRRAYLGY